MLTVTVPKAEAGQPRWIPVTAWIGTVAGFLAGHTNSFLPRTRPPA